MPGQHNSRIVTGTPDADQALRCPDQRPRSPLCVPTGATAPPWQGCLKWCKLAHPNSSTPCYNAHWYTTTNIMGRKHVESYIRREKRDTRSTDDQIKLSHAMWESEELPSEEGVTRSDAEDEWAADLDHNVKTCLRHLEEINIVEEFREPGPDTYVIAEWHDETFIMGMVDEAADEGVEALIYHVQNEDPPTGDDTPAVADGGSVTLRQVVAQQFDLRPDAVECHLRSGNQVEKLNEAVEGIEEHDEFTTRDDYGEIRFVKAPYQYRLTEFAVDLYTR